MSKILSKSKVYFYLNRFSHGANLCHFIRRFSDDIDFTTIEPLDDFISPITRNPQPKIVIIGAGIAGLSAADYLIKQGFMNVSVLEASDRFGGRICSVPFGDAICELGARWINASQNPNSLHAIVRKHGIREIVTLFDDVNYMTSKGEALNCDIAKSASLMLGVLISSVQSKAAESGIRDTRACLQSAADNIASNTFKDYSPIARKIFGSLFRDLGSFVGCDLSNVSIAHLGQIAKSFSNPFWISSGIGEISRILANSLLHSQLLLGKPVGSVRWSMLQSQEKAYVTCLDGSKYSADHIICTLPLGILKTFSDFVFLPKIPESKRNAIFTLGIGSPGKIYLKYPRNTTWFLGTLKPIWSVTEMENDSDWCLGVSEISPVPGSKNILEVKIGGAANEEVERCSDKIVAEKLTQLLRRFLRNDIIPYPKELLRSFWSTDGRYLGGQAYLSLNSDETHVHELSLPLAEFKESNTPVLLFAGDATIAEGFGTLEGARQSGIREAKRIINFYLQKSSQGME